MRLPRFDPLVVMSGLRKPDPPLLLGPGVGQSFGETRDREIGRDSAIDDGRYDFGRDEGEWCQQTDVCRPVALLEAHLHRLRLDDDALDMAFDEVAIRAGGRVLGLSDGLQVPADGSRTRFSTSGAGHARHGTGILLAFLNQGLRDIVPVPDTPLVRMRRAHPVTAVVEDPSREDSRRPIRPDPPLDGVRGKLCPHGVDVDLAGTDVGEQRLQGRAV